MFENTDLSRKKELHCIYYLGIKKKEKKTTLWKVNRKVCRLSSRDYLIPLSWNIEVTGKLRTSLSTIVNLTNDKNKHYRCLFWVR